MKLSIFLTCYNEEILIPHTVRHYKKYLPSSEITIFDNYSTDNSAFVAKELGCCVIKWGNKNQLEEHQLTHLKNNCWKFIYEGWIIVCDMDEWLCIDETFLKEEESLGTTVIKTIGYNIVGNSKLENLSDIDPMKLSEGHHEGFGMDKNVCFKVPQIKEINFSHGSHSCNPQGEVKFGGPYLLKHMSWLGLPYRQKMNKIKYDRSKKMREKYGLAVHYKNSFEEVEKEYKYHIDKKQDIKNLCNCFG